jgi:molecular chaperone GrpE
MYDEIDSPSSRPGDNPSWKREILDNCHAWLSDLPEMPGLTRSDSANEPDLYSFYEQLCILRNEFRKNSRRSHELFSQFGDHLEEFQSVLDAVTERTERLSHGLDSAQDLARHGLLLQMVELYERLRLFGEKMAEIGISAAEKPGFGKMIKGLFTGKESSPSGIPGSMQEGFGMILSHFHGFMEKEGVFRIRTTGEPFDPSVMVAVGTVDTADCPSGIVYEEISGGYLYGDQIIMLAKVTVAKSKET